MMVAGGSMRRLLFLLLVCLTPVSGQAQAEGFKLKSSERVLILGDSITHGLRRTSIGNTPNRSST